MKNTTVNMTLTPEEASIIEELRSNGGKMKATLSLMETNPQNFKILSIIDEFDDEDFQKELGRIRMDALEVFCGETQDKDWYDGFYLYDGVVQIETSPCMKDGYVSGRLFTNRWLSKNVSTFVEKHSDLISEFEVGASENLHEVTFIKRDLTKEQLNQVFIDFIEFLRDVCPCEVIGSIERTESTWE